MTGAGERALSRLRRQRVGFVFQFFHLLPELTGEANVLLAGARARSRGRRPRSAAQALIDRLGLRDVAELAAAPVVAAASSSASRSRARWSTTRPCCWPTSRPGNLDMRAGAEVLRLLRAGADEGRAVILVTHEPAAAGIADRVLTLRDGRLIP